jgi:hypothetical protein
MMEAGFATWLVQDLSINLITINPTITEKAMMGLCTLRVVNFSTSKVWYIESWFLFEENFC